jgi:hypothetical protein
VCRLKKHLQINGTWLDYITYLQREVPHTLALILERSEVGESLTRNEVARRWVQDEASGMTSGWGIAAPSEGVVSGVRRSSNPGGLLLTHIKI